MSNKDKRVSEQVGRNIAGMMVGNDKAMIDFLLMIEPSLTREELEKAASEGKLWSQEFDGAVKSYEESEPQAARSMATEEHSDEVGKVC